MTFRPSTRHENAVFWGGGGGQETLLVRCSRQAIWRPRQRAMIPHQSRPRASRSLNQNQNHQVQTRHDPANQRGLDFPRSQKTLQKSRLNTFRSHKASVCLPLAPNHRSQLNRHQASRQRLESDLERTHLIFLCPISATSGQSRRIRHQLQATHTLRFLNIAQRSDRILLPCL